MKTTLELLRERLLKDKEIFPHYNEYINGILYDIDNELLAMEKEQIIEAYYGQSYSTNVANGEQYYNETFKSEKYNTDIRSMDKLIESNKKFDENNLKGFKYDPNDRSEDTPDITNFFY